MRILWRANFLAPHLANRWVVRGLGGALTIAFFKSTKITKPSTTHACPLKLRLEMFLVKLLYCQC